MGTLLDPKAAAALLPYLSDPNGVVSVLTNVPQKVAGAAFSRLSRSDKTVAQILLTEFMLDDPESETGHRFDAEKGDDFFARVFAQYGDESVAELMAAHVAVARCSNLAAKALEEHRLASFLEKSSRYVYYDARDDAGHFLYYRPDDIMKDEVMAPRYVATLDQLFETYAALQSPVRAALAERYPRQDGESEAVWKMALKGKTADILRGLLPAATLTNLGIFANARAYEYMISQLKANRLPEVRDLAGGLHRELGKTFGSVLSRLGRESGIAMTGYREQINALLQLAHDEFPPTVKPSTAGAVRLHSVGTLDAQTQVFAALLFSAGGATYERCYGKASSMNARERAALVRELAALRQVRHHKPPQAFEMIPVVFEIEANFGVYKDLQRHRLLSRPRQQLDTALGYDTPELIRDIGQAGAWDGAMAAAAALVQELRRGPYAHLAEYPVPNAYRLRWLMSGNFREFVYLLELRTIEQGHPEYRLVCQRMARLLEERLPELAPLLKFVDHQTYGLERRAAAKKQEQLLERLGGRLDDAG